MVRPSTCTLAQTVNAARRTASAADKAKGGNFVLNGIPRTALPADVLRALRAQGLVSKHFSLSNITPFPISLPRTHSLQRSYHLELNDSEAASKIARSIRDQPLFPHFYTNSRPSDVTSDNAQDFVNRAIDSFEKLLWTKEQRANLQANEKGRFDRDWVRKSGVSGKRVVLKGLPLRIPEGAVRKIVDDVVVGELGGDSGLLPGLDGVKLLPESPNRYSSVIALEFNTVSEACRAARKLNMSPHQSRSISKSENPPPPAIMRAEVVW